MYAFISYKLSFSIIAKKRVKKEPVSSSTAPESASYRWSVFDLAKVRLFQMLLKCVM